MPPKISCVIPAYNAASHLARAVDSLQACGRSDLEIIIVDDGSRDHTADVAREIASSSRGVRFLQHVDCGNHGVSATRNHGIELSQGELICLLDADDYVYPHRFDAAVDILQTRPDVDGVYELTEVVFANDSARATWWTDQNLFGFREPIEPSDLLQRLLRGYCWATSAILFRRSLLSRSGLFDPRLRIAEDCNLWFRMACTGQLVAGNLSRPVSVYWRNTASTYQPGVSQRLQMLKSMLMFLNWLKKRQDAATCLNDVERSISEYVLNGIITARQAKQRQTAWWLAGHSLQMYPRLALYNPFQRQILSMALLR